MNEISLEKIAKIYSGIRNSSMKDTEPTYQYDIITLTNENNFRINKNQLETIKTNKKLDEKYLLKKGDIIMRLTPPYTSRIIEFNEKNVTTTSNYAIIKVNENYSPEILNFYLNSYYIKKQIHQVSEENSMKVVNIINIKKFNIIQIEEDKKETYINLIETFKNKKHLMEKQIQLEENLIEEIIFGE